MVSNRSVCYGVIGRCRRQQGRIKEAAKAFELAANTAALNMYTFLESVALRDLKTVVANGSASAGVTASTLSSSEANGRTSSHCIESAKVNARFDNAMAILGWKSKVEVEALVARLFVF